MPKKTAKKSLRVRRQRNKSKSWKSFKLFSKVKHAFFLIFLSFCAVAISIVLLFSIYFFKVIRTPFASGVVNNSAVELSNSDTYALSFIVLDNRNDEYSRINALYVAFVNKRTQTVKVYSVPVGYSMDLPERFGEGEISKVYSLGTSSDNNSGVQLTNKTLEKIFAKKVDRYILTDTNSLNDFASEFDVNSVSGITKLTAMANLPKAKDGLLKLHNDFESNLSLPDLWSVISMIYSLPPSGISQTNLSSDDLNDLTSLDDTLKDFFVDPGIVNENKRILILNGTNVPLLGLAASRFIDKFGVSVVAIDNTSKEYQKSMIITNSTGSETLKKISYELGIGNVVNPQAAGSFDENEAVSADIVVVVGIDFANSL